MNKLLMMCEGAYIVSIPASSQPSSVKTDEIHRGISEISSKHPKGAITISREFIEDISEINGEHPKDTFKVSHELIKDASGIACDHLKQAPGISGRDPKMAPEMGGRQFKKSFRSSSDPGGSAQISAKNSGVTFEVGEECLEVILVSGEVYCPNTQQYLLAPCIVPRSVR